MSNEIIIQAAQEAIGTLRAHDPDRYLLTMMAPPARRWAVGALYAFNLELARIPDIVSEPILGRMRLQWWRDALLSDAPARGGLQSLLRAATESFAIAPSLFTDAIDAREADLDDEPPFADAAALQRYADRSAGGLGEAVYRVVAGDGSDNAVRAARNAATAFALVGIARSAPRDLAAGRSRIPLDQFDPADAGAAQPGAVRPAIEALCGSAAERIAGARAESGRVERRHLAAFAPATLAETYLATLARCGYDPYDPRNGYRGAGAALKLAFYRMRGRF